MAAAAAYLFLFLESVMEQGIVQRPAFTIAAQTGIVTLAKAVEIGLCRLALQTAGHHEGADGDVSVAGAATQRLIHSLRVVHLAVAYVALLPTEAVATTIGILDELLGGDELYAAIHHVVPRHLVWVGMLAKQLQLRGQRAERRFHTIAFAQPHRSHLAEQVEEMLDLSLARMAVFGAEVIDGIEVVFILYDGLGIEQGLAVVALRGARLQFKEYSVSLAWHIMKSFKSTARVLTFIA